MSRATYKVTSYIDLDPYLANFEIFEKYLSAFKEDLADKNKMGTIMDEDSRYKLRGYEWDCSQKLPSQFDSIRCRFHRQYLRILKETDVITDLFRSVYQRFLAAIDHLDYYPHSEGSRERRYIQEGEYLPKREYEELDASESAFLNPILEEIQKLRPEVHKELIREKRFNLMTWIIGWGTWSNMRNMKKIKENMQALQDQNILQEKQILELTHYLNLTMNQVREHRNILYDIDNRLLYIKKNPYDSY